MLNKWTVLKQVWMFCELLYNAMWDPTPHPPSKHGRNWILEKHNIQLYNTKTTLLGITYCASKFEWHKRTSFVLWTKSEQHYYPLISALNFLLITFMSVILCNPHHFLISDKIISNHRRQPRRWFNCIYFPPLVW